MYKEPEYSHITFCIDDYTRFGMSTDEARGEMWKDISTQLQILLKTRHNALVREDEVDIVVIEYGHDENIDAWGCDHLMWVTSEEHEKIEDSRFIEESEDTEDVWDGPDKNNYDK